jgi:hypothetical protein
MYYRCREIFLFLLQLSLSDDEGRRFSRITGKCIPDHTSEKTAKLIVTVVRTPKLSQKTFVLLFSIMSPTLDQRFSTFVRPRPGKFFFYKTRARFQQIIGLQAIFMTGHTTAVFPFPNFERFWCLKIPDHSWILPCLKIRGLVTDICNTDAIEACWVWAFRHIHDYYSPLNISTIKYLSTKNA